MSVELGLLDEQEANTQYAPLAALSAHYQQNNILKPLEAGEVGMKTVEYNPTSKLQQAFVGILAGCEYVSEVNTRLRPDLTLARVWQLDGFAEHSTTTT